jgi:hypothetical protein
MFRMSSRDGNKLLSKYGWPGIDEHQNKLLIALCRKLESSKEYQISSLETCQVCSRMHSWMQHPSTSSSIYLRFFASTVSCNNRYVASRSLTHQNHQTSWNRLASLKPLLEGLIIYQHLLPSFLLSRMPRCEPFSVSIFSVSSNLVLTLNFELPASGAEPVHDKCFKAAAS